MTALEYSESIYVASSPEQVYDMVADIARMGEWSPVCKACWWDDGDGPWVGSHFTGRNELPDRTWQTRSLIVAADRGREFAWLVNDGVARWSYSFSPEGGGARVRESWALLPHGITVFHDRFGVTANEEIEARSRAARSGIPLTLAAIKRAAEAS